MLRLQAEALRVSREVRRALAAALGQDEDYLDQWFDEEAAVHVKIVQRSVLPPPLSSQRFGHSARAA
ncbi:hypothetical protein [Streptomyces scabichelini]|uniref:hypothetical protein n=1 Tax=Streptomyces scabichelini TaxID=2711217 RepID=UPI001F49D439|nr:hypothetical protein [Streptomyces scabichelini]